MKRKGEKRKKMQKLFFFYSRDHVLELQEPFLLYVL